MLKRDTSAKYDIPSRRIIARVGVVFIVVITRIIRWVERMNPFSRTAGLPVQSNYIALVEKIVNRKAEEYPVVLILGI